ncbi:sulfotransferase domain-containing protein [Mangrovimonas xylaniphaga]|uniref:sulfotransferase domain-containing protein n=1 Tax=Mangrovimonas xylaniphaga TaxID=1645915 RepID=UPI0006B66102|nr:sulfotransferase domain-containing protein [Mangrovimonas xylaniphaga]
MFQPKYQKHLIVVGSARSGTSWLSETLAQQRRYRMLFEPEHDTRTKDGILLCDQWISKKEDYKAATRYLRRILNNRVDCDWIAQHSNRSFKRHLWPFVPKKYIIKFVRGNLMAKYIHAHFGVPVIHLIRNPYDVLQSQKRANFPWLINLEYFVQQEHLVAMIQERFNFDIRTYKSLSYIECLSLRWCIENVIPLEVDAYGSKQISVVRYEDLITDMGLFYTLCQQYAIRPIDDLERFYKLPSSKTHKKSAVRTQKPRQRLLTREELDGINRILDLFNCNLYARQ